MNSKGITALSDTCICMKCLKKKGLHSYYIRGRGYGSMFDGQDCVLNLCADCDNDSIRVAVDEVPEKTELGERYIHESEILDYVNSLPVEGRELFENRFSEVFHMEPQDWIDYELDELSDEKCHNYDLYSPKDISAYNERFPVCMHVANVLWDDGSRGAWCPFGAHGDYGPEVHSVSTECAKCRYFGRREGNTPEISGSDLDDWQTWRISVIRRDEFISRFGGTE